MDCCRHPPPQRRPSRIRGCPDRPIVGALPWGRLQTLLEAKIIEADPIGAEQQAAAAASERFVRLGRNSEHGLKLIIARAAAGDAIWFKATIDRIADILTQQGDPDPVEIRRSKAIGILANPPTPSSCSANTNTTTGTDPPNPPTLPKTQPNTSRTQTSSRRRSRTPSRPTSPT